MTEKQKICPIMSKPDDIRGMKIVYCFKERCECYNEQEKKCMWILNLRKDHVNV